MRDSNLVDGKVVPLPKYARVDNALWSSDGNWLALSSGREVGVFAFPGAERVDHWTASDDISCLAFSPDSTELAIGAAKALHIRDFSTSSFARSPIPFDHRPLCAVFSPDGSRAAVLCGDQQVRVAAVRGAEVHMPPQRCSIEDRMLEPVFLDNHRLVVVDSHGAVTCWNLDRGERIWQRTWRRALAFAASADRKHLAVGENFDAAVLDAATGADVGKRIVHRNMVLCFAFDPKGSLLLHASDDMTVRASHVLTGEPAINVIPHNNTVHRCVWAPDGKTFATVNWNNPIVRVWKPGDSSRRISQCREDHELLF